MEIVTYKRRRYKLVSGEKILHKDLLYPTELNKNKGVIIAPKGKDALRELNKLSDMYFKMVRTVRTNEETKALSRLYYRQNSEARDKAKERFKKYYLENKELIAAKKKVAYIKNPNPKEYYHKIYKYKKFERAEKLAKYFIKEYEENQKFRFELGKVFKITKLEEHEKFI